MVSRMQSNVLSRNGRADGECLLRPASGANLVFTSHPFEGIK